MERGAADRPTVVASDETSLPTADGLPLCVRRWNPPGRPRAVVVVLHGICEHGGRYQRFAAELAGQGYAVCVLDLRGHGRSPGEPVAIRRFDDYCDDAVRALHFAAGEHPGCPLVLFGHSMGGAIALRTALSDRMPLAGLVLSAPAVCVAGNLFPLLRHLAAFFSVVWPGLRLTRMGSRFLSRDLAVVAEFRADPLVFHGKFPVRTGAEILRAANRIQREMAALGVPFLVLHGTGDIVTDPRGSQMLYQQARAADKSLKLYPGLYHDLLHEPEWPQVTADIGAWLAARW